MADSLLQALYYKSDSSTCEELEKELESADEVTIRRTSDSLLNLPIHHHRRATPNGNHFR
jgi:energy-converting hydrogenase A subunit M